MRNETALQTEARKTGFPTVELWEQYSTNWMLLTEQKKLPEDFIHERDFCKLYAAIEKSDTKILTDYLEKKRSEN